jgi:hypothetical protein
MRQEEKYAEPILTQNSKAIGKVQTRIEEILREEGGGFKRCDAACASLTNVQAPVVEMLLGIMKPNAAELMVMQAVGIVLGVGGGLAAASSATEEALREQAWAKAHLGRDKQAWRTPRPTPTKNLALEQKECRGRRARVRMDAKVEQKVEKMAIVSLAPDNNSDRRRDI